MAIILFRWQASPGAEKVAGPLPRQQAADLLVTIRCCSIKATTSPSNAPPYIAGSLHWNSTVAVWANTLSCFAILDHASALSAAFLAGIFMARMINCIKLGREAEGLEHLPYPGELGKRIWESISKEAWRQWLDHQKMLINENRLSLADQKAREYLVAQMDAFFFGAGADAIAGFVAPQLKK